MYKIKKMDSGELFSFTTRKELKEFIRENKLDESSLFRTSFDFKRRKPERYRNSHKGYKMIELPNKDLKKIEQFIELNFNIFCDKWKDFFQLSSIDFLNNKSNN